MFRKTNRRVYNDCTGILSSMYGLNNVVRKWYSFLMHASSHGLIKSAGNTKKFFGKSYRVLENVLCRRGCSGLGTVADLNILFCDVADVNEEIFCGA